MATNLFPWDSALKRQGPQLVQLLLDYPIPDFPEAVAQEVVSYVVGNQDVFGADAWKRYFGVDVGPEPELSEEFYRFWYGPDPVDPNQKVCATHLLPVLRPERVIQIDSGISSPFSLRTLEHLAAHPQNSSGRAMGYENYGNEAQALQQCGGIEAGPACWLVMRKSMLHRDYQRLSALCDDQQNLRRLMKRFNEATGGNYDELPSAIDLATIVCTHYLSTGERYLGSNTGMEGDWTHSPCRERVWVLDDGSVSTTVNVGGFDLIQGRGQLRIAPFSFDRYAGTNVAIQGIAAVRAFSARAVPQNFSTDETASREEKNSSETSCLLS